MFQREHVTAFNTAAQNGIPRVVHAGFFGTADSVVGALLLLKADRISHGYHIIDDEEVYKMMIQLKVPFETTPSSANLIATGETNPVVRYARDGVTFSISTDNPSQLVNEYRLLAEWGITAKKMQQSVRN